MSAPLGSARRDRCRRRFRVVMHCSTFIATFIGAAGCAERSLAPTNVHAHVAVGVRIERASAVVSFAAPLDVEITVSYVRNALANVVIGSGTAVVQSGTGSADVPLDVNLGACLADPSRAATGDVCPIVLSAVLRRGGAFLDSTSLGPVNAIVGDVMRISAPLVLRELARLRLSWTGSAPSATGDTLRVGRTLALTASAEDAIGTAIPDRSMSWTSSDPSVAAVGAQTGVVTGLAPGTATITGNSVGRSVTFEAQVYAAAQNVEFVGGDDQNFTLSNFGATIVVSPSVRVTDAQGRPAPLVGIAFSVIAGGGQLALVTFRTDTAGFALAGAWTLGGTGVNTLQATVSGLAPVSLNAYLPIDGQLAVGRNHACSLLATGATNCWGSRLSGAIGDNQNNSSVSARTSPVDNPVFTSIVSHAETTCGTTSTGATTCWGRFGAVDGTSNQLRTVPTPFVGGPFKAFGTSRLGGCYLTLPGDAYCWGNNQAGEVGDGTTLTQLSPTPVVGSPQFERIETSWMSNCGLTMAGAAYCWGRPAGQGSQNSLPPTLIAGHQFVSLHAGGTHTCGLKANGEAWCWGDNGAGQLGDSTTVTTLLLTPVRATNMHFTRLATSSQANLPARGKTCGLTITGAGYCWGNNQSGELGNGQNSLRELQAVRMLTTEAFVAIGMGEVHGCAMTPDRRVFCWGDNVSGQLGSGSIVPGQSNFPIIVP